MSNSEWEKLDEIVSKLEAGSDTSIPVGPGPVIDPAGDGSNANGPNIGGPDDGGTDPQPGPGPVVPPSPAVTFLSSGALVEASEAFTGAWTNIIGVWNRGSIVLSQASAEDFKVEPQDGKFVIRGIAGGQSVTVEITQDSDFLDRVKVADGPDGSVVITAYDRDREAADSQGAQYFDQTGSFIDQPPTDHALQATVTFGDGSSFTTA